MIGEITGWNEKICLDDNEYIFLVGKQAVSVCLISCIGDKAGKKS